MNPTNLFWYLLVMAGVTYLVRMVPLVAFRIRARSRFFRSLLHYIPYAVLGVMTIPAIFTSTGNVPAAVVGFLVAGVLAFFRKSLLTVALAASVSAYLAALLLPLLGLGG